MQTVNLKRVSTVLFVIAFICGLCMLTEKTYGYRNEIHAAFFITGAIALIVSLISSRLEITKGDFNILFWLGNLIIFIGLLLKTYHVRFDTYVIFAGIGISAFSYFVNPFAGNRDREQEDELLDQ